MIEDGKGLTGKAARLRETFDRGFAEPPRTANGEHEDVLAIRIAGRPFALRARQLATIVKDKKIVPFPSTSSGLIGMAGVRAAIVPVYSLAALLGFSSNGDAGLKWLAMAGTPAVGLAFEELVSFERIEKDDSGHGRNTTADAGFVHRVALIGGTVHGIIDVQAVVEHIMAGNVSAMPKEQ